MHHHLPKPYITKVRKTHGPMEVDQRIHSPHTTSSAFPPQPERQAYEQQREKQLNNGSFMTLFYKALPTTKQPQEEHCIYHNSDGHHELCCKKLNEP